MNIKEVDIDSVRPNKYNPNEMSPEKLAMLSEDIELEELVDQPIVVVSEDDGYVIVDGEHRWRAAKQAGLDTIYIVEKDWDEVTRKVNTIRRNVLRGSLNPVKFTALMHSVQADTRLDTNAIRKKMGFSSEKEVGRLLLKDSRKKDLDLEVLAAGVDDVARDSSMVSALVRMIMLEYGGTVKQGAICFSYHGLLYFGMETNHTVLDAVTELDALIKDVSPSKERINAIMAEGIKHATAVLEGDM